MRTLLLIHSKRNGLHQLTANLQSIPLPSPSAAANLFSMLVSLFLFCRQVHLCLILVCTCKWDHMVFAFLFLTFHSSLSMIIYGCIHVVANGIGLLFLWLNSIPSHTHTHWVAFLYMYMCVCVCIYLYIHTYRHTPCIIVLFLWLSSTPLHTHTHTHTPAPHLLCWWIFRWFPCLGYHEECCYGHWGAYIFF